MRRLLAGFLLAACASTVAWAQQPDRAEILVLGTFHMANPGRDLHSGKVDDMLSPTRQREITELIEVLKRFRPTRIAVEASVGSQRVAQQYADYLAGKYTLSANEIDQVGYRLARELHHSKVYAVDEDGEFPFYRVRNYAIANGKNEKFEASQSEIGARVKAENEYLASHTVLETLQLLNADSTTARAVGEYYTAFAPYGEPYEYAGPDLLASWFQRNIRIHRNISACIESPAERVLVIYGAGHLGWMRQNVANDPAMRLRTLSEYADHK